MIKDIDCQIFEDQLDSLQAGTLAEEGLRQLRLHASSCPECAMSMKVLEHLALPSLEELEKEVPDDLLAGVWQGVVAGIDPSAETSHGDASGGPPSRRSTTWLLPTLAAASMALLFSTGFLFLELKRSETRSVRLAGQMADLQEEIDRSDANGEWIQRTAQLAGNRRSRARALDYALAGQEGVTVATLVELLGRYPEDMVLFEASEIESLLGMSVRPPPELRRLLSSLAVGLTTLDDPREVRAGELAKWLATSGLPQDLVVPKSPLLALLS